MARDIEEFLRKAAERRQQAARGNAPPPPPPPPTPVPPQQKASPVVKPVKQPRNKTRTEVPVAEEVRNRESVAEHVRKTVNPQAVAAGARRLGQEVALADDKLEARLHEKFDHTVSRLSGEEAAASGSKSRKGGRTAEVNLFEMLRSPKNIAQAILLSEILKRPNFD